ncbi:alpha/beta-type small acid-soluble spore protein [Bacillus cereus]|nr:alpha/beta-type small acid-soluble spore protein [Bacillus cereus]
MLFINIQRYESDTNEILISATTSTIEQMKYESAFELGVTITSSANGSDRWRDYKTLSLNG